MQLLQVHKNDFMMESNLHVPQQVQAVTQAKYNAETNTQAPRIKSILKSMLFPHVDQENFTA